MDAAALGRPDRLAAAVDVLLAGPRETAHDGPLSAQALERPAGPQGRIRSSARRIREASGRTAVPPPIARISRRIDMPNPQVQATRVAKTGESRVKLRRPPAPSSGKGAFGASRFVWQVCRGSGGSFLLPLPACGERVG